MDNLRKVIFRDLVLVTSILVVLFLAFLTANVTGLSYGFKELSGVRAILLFSILWLLLVVLLLIIGLRNLSDRIVS